MILQAIEIMNLQAIEIMILQVIEIMILQATEIWTYKQLLLADWYLFPRVLLHLPRRVG